MNNLENQNAIVAGLADLPTVEQSHLSVQAVTGPTAQVMPTMKPLSISSSPPTALSSPPVSVTWLWTPGTIASVSLLCTYPIGSILAARNWYQLDLRQKAHNHLIGSSWVIFGLFHGFWLPERSFGYLFGIIYMISMSRYLFVQMENDIAEYRTGEQQVIEANGCLGLLIGLGLGLLYVICLTLLFTFVPVLIIGAVLFLLTVFVLLVPAGESVF